MSDPNDRRNPIGPVLGMGAVAIDELLTVASYPLADGKARVLGRARRIGGLAGTALLAAARLGVPCSYAGVIGDDEAGDLVLQTLREAGIDTSMTRRRPGAGPIRSTIIVGRDDESRTIFSNRSGFVGPDPDWPPGEAIRSASALLVDHIGVVAMLRAARIAREAGVPVVGDFERDEEPGFRELLATTDHLILARSFAAWLTGSDDPGEAAKRLCAPGQSAVVVTCGEAGVQAVDALAPDETIRVPALPVRVIDTTGCGDVFHGVYAVALAEGRPLIDRLRLASAAAGIVAGRPADRRLLPDRTELLSRIGDLGG
ncbi:carbohydrate kinase family protein [Tautonia sociabilis]|uniref:Permease n=1 Tax=Tautonia sociabilis TaxID=2080755 RepID=A0A432MJH5_9BACT|nr:PfkB family carbohydrate kinase [Tautonia sociabilis]RUL87357.1 permease [Tautonia sociabilis]